MAGKKAGPVAPIDRPLARAYLREFTGWSTEYPPGASDPTSLRIMENLMINRRGSVRIRPGLRLRTVQAGLSTLPAGETIVGSHEAFYLNDGTLAYLFAVRTVGPGGDGVYFRVASVTPGNDALTIGSLSGVGFDLSAWGGAGSSPRFTAATTYVKYLQIDNKILALSNAGEPLIVLYVGATKRAAYPMKIERPLWNVEPSTGVVLYQPTFSWQANAAGEMQTVTPPAASAYSVDSLISNDPLKNIYNIGVFYTYSNELGESEASDVTVGRISRPYGGWRREGMDAPSGPGGAPVPNGLPPVWPVQSGDTLVAKIPSSDVAGWDHAIGRGATAVNFYVFAWSDQDSVPVEASLAYSQPLDEDSTYDLQGYVLLNPWSAPGDRSVIVPSLTNRYNSSAPSRAGNGLVAADRMVLVYDPTAAAVVRWTTNEQGNYLNFSPNRGGGYKTLTSGNMQVPASVKLWQNPQSADTITILNLGTDGHSTGYYMQPAQVASQSDATNIMGFEETTATPGTTSPYGVEVANNALFHPLDDQLMKSTASNYNISHKATTDMIAREWARLEDKHKIVSCLHDGRLYYLVNNPLGASLEPGCNGNEVWVLDMVSEGGSWSRWLTQGVSLRKTKAAGKIHLGMLRPEGWYYFDPAYAKDDYVEGGLRKSRNIQWYLETNTQGANRAHDAWAHLRQAQITLGNFAGRMRWGVKGLDQHGKRVNVEKLTKADGEILDTELTWDLEDQLRIGRDMKEWIFFAGSTFEPRIPDHPEVPAYSAGQITLVQYRYAPVSVNIGYEFGSVETFEYGRDVAQLATTVTDNGVPQPFNDQARP